METAFAEKLLWRGLELGHLMVSEMVLAGSSQTIGGHFEANNKGWGYCSLGLQPTRSRAQHPEQHTFPPTEKSSSQFYHPVEVKLLSWRATPQVPLTQCSASDW